jgi:hypothetical protein
MRQSGNPQIWGSVCMDLMVKMDGKEDLEGYFFPRFQLFVASVVAETVSQD